MGKRMDIQAVDYGDGGQFIVTWCPAGEGEAYVTVVTLEGVVRMAKGLIDLGIGNGKVSGLSRFNWLELASAYEFSKPATDKEIGASELYSVVWVQKGAVVK